LPALRRIDAAERRVRLAQRHHLAPRARATTAVEVARDLVGLHGTTASSVFLSARARLRKPEVAAIERELYEDRTLVRMLGMRRTMFVVPRELAPIMNAACTRAIAVRERRRLVQWVEQAGIARDGGRWLKSVERSALEILVTRGEATASELAEDEPRLKRQLRLAWGKEYEGVVGIGTKVLFVLAAEGRVIRRRPLGTWASSQFHWSPMDPRLSDAMARWSEADAQVELVRRWLAAFGPGTVADLAWWTGLGSGQIRKAIGQIGPLEVLVDGVSALVLPDDVESPRPIAPAAVLLPGLDPTVMGWSERSWYLGKHGKALFDRSGNAGPTVWWDGRIVGGWAQRKSGEIAYRLLEDIGSQGNAAVEAEAHRLGDWFGPVRATPTFRTPLEKELSS
jgi:winged helix DNA-binding protein